MTAEIAVSGPGFRYPVLIGRGLINDPRCWRAASPGGKVMVVTNDTVGGLYLEPLAGALDEAGIRHGCCVLPDGEQHKTLDTWRRIIDRLADSGIRRQDAVIALGGGVIGDLAGFAAATYMRGIDVLQAPTTLLAQVDAAIGGKTGVNLPQGKNLVGAFHQPGRVIIDTDTLATLPEREYRAGLAEVIKYAAIMDAPLFEWLAGNAERVLERAPPAIGHLIETCVRHKADIVAADAREQGRRALLNFGHSFAHALETCTGYARWLHGEAVAIGMHMAAEFGVRLGLTPARDRDRLLQLLRRYGFDLELPAELDANRLAGALRLDKKADTRGITLILLESIGKAGIRPGFEARQLEDFFRGYVAATTSDNS